MAIDFIESVVECNHDYIYIFQIYISKNIIITFLLVELFFLPWVTNCYLDTSVCCSQCREVVRLNTVVIIYSECV